MMCHGAEKKQATKGIIRKFNIMDKITVNGDEVLLDVDVDVTCKGVPCHIISLVLKETSQINSKDEERKEFMKSVDQKRKDGRKQRNGN